MWTIPGEVNLVKYGYVGRVRLAPHRFDYLFLDIRLRTDDQEWETTTHEIVTGPMCLSICGTVWKTRARRGDCYAAGQCREDFASPDLVLDGAIDAAELAKLLRVWDRWHLNTMRAGCEHQEVPPDMPTEQRLRSIPPCPVTGYRWGSKWLTEPLPAEVEQFARDIAAKLAAQ